MAEDEENLVFRERLRVPRALYALGAFLGSMAVILVAVAVWLSSKPVQGTTGLLAQENALIASFQALLGFAVAMGTIYYAMRTNDMVRAMETAERNSGERVLQSALSNLVGAVLAVATTSGAIAELMSTNLGIARLSRRRDRLVTPLVTQAMTELSNALRWAQDVAAIEPSLRARAQGLVDAAVEINSVAFGGEPAQTLHHGKVLRDLVDALYLTVSELPTEQAPRPRITGARESKFFRRPANA